MGLDIDGGAVEDIKRSLSCLVEIYPNLAKITPDLVANQHARSPSGVAL